MQIQEDRLESARAYFEERKTKEAEAQSIFRDSES
jgi:hypothetical protein